MPKVDLKAIRKTRPDQYALRFAFGGLITAVAGLIAVRFGPVIGGLFLGFPAILPASVSLVQDHAKQDKPEQEAKKEAGDDSLGASIGSLGLIAFGLTVWLGVSYVQFALLLVLGGAVWLTVSISAWYLFGGLRK
ncbi:MAG TPA: DUF3147 family protein [Fimbriimonadaceae bacterium]|jgi:hypothetical protein